MADDLAGRVMGLPAAGTVKNYLLTIIDAGGPYQLGKTYRRFGESIFDNPFDRIRPKPARRSDAGDTPPASGVDPFGDTGIP